MVEVELCEDLLDEIIARLPPKFILQFRCVSKSWCSRIDSSNFIRKQAIRSSTRSRRSVNVAHQVHIKKDVYKILCRSKPKGRLLKIDSLKFPGDCSSFDSCYGIICIYNYQTNVPSITLWNPSIRRKLNVPEIPNFNPCHSVEFGFGYDPIADDYNVVSYSYEATLRTLFLYSTKTNAWSEIELHKIDPTIKVESLAYFVNGVMHWLVVKNDSSNTNDSYILTFDLTSRVFGTIPLPSTTRGAIDLSFYIGYLTVISDMGGDSSMWLRKLDDNNVASYWSKPFKVKFYYDDIDGIRVFKVKKDEQMEVPKAYNPFTEASWTRVSCKKSCVTYEIDSYMETLALLDNKNCSTNKETNMFEKILSCFRRL